MPISIEGKRIIVTGGGRGIGAATVRYFVAEGAHVAAFDILDEGTQVAADASVAGPGSATFRHVDVSDAGQVVAAVDAAMAELGGLDAAFSIAGIELSSPAEAIDEAAWDRTLGVNVKGVAHVCQGRQRCAGVTWEPVPV
jgi:2-hydroxycyclohexanecarboxyl-CoA dehydrogenase